MASTTHTYTVLLPTYPTYHIASISLISLPLYPYLYIYITHILFSQKIKEVLRTIHTTCKMNKSSTLQFRSRMHDRARKGERLTDEEITEITRESAELAGADSGRANHP